MRQTPAHYSYTGPRMSDSCYDLSPLHIGCHRPSEHLGHTRGAPPGFTLIEVTVALAIMFIVLVSVLSTVVFVYRSSAKTEQINVAKNVATYTSEYLRSRTVTSTSDLAGYLGVKNLTAGMLAFRTNSADGALPAIVDPWNLPLQPWGHACSYAWDYAVANPAVAVDGQTADGRTMRYSSLHAALLSQAYNAAPLAYSFVLQGYDSLRALTALPSAASPAPEDGNLLITAATDAANGLIGHYETLLGSNHPLVLFPGTYQGMPDIREFTALPGYLPRVYTADHNKTVASSLTYNPYYTDDTNLRSATMKYRGYRVLLSVVARTTVAATPLESYDVRITVLWNDGGKESSYELQTKIGVF